MDVVARSIRCSHCGGPVEFNPGEIVASCRYCGFTTVIETGKPFIFEHSLILNKFDLATVEKYVKNWMDGGFLKPSDLARKSKVIETTLVYLPFWVVSAEAKSTYKGLFERIAPVIVKEGVLSKEYDWVILAREASEFSTREYAVPLEGKIPFDFRRIEGFAKVLNSEVDRDNAYKLAQTQIDNHHRFLLRQEVDRIIEMKTEFSLKKIVYLHAPVWFIRYEYRGKAYKLVLDGVTAIALKGDIPTKKF